MRLAACALLATLLAACGSPAPSVPSVPTPPWWSPGPAPHHGTLALTRDGARLVVALPDSDAVALVDVRRRALVREIPLGDAPSVDRDGRWATAVAPRAVALAPGRARVYVACERSGEVVALDLAGDGRIAGRAPACARTVSVLVSADESRVFASCASDEAVVALDAATLAPVGRVTVPGTPWALGLSDDGATLLVTDYLAGRVTALDAATLAVDAVLPVPEVPARGHPSLAHGVPRALADVAARPGTGELWVPHALYATDTAQPALNFETTVFPAVAVVGEARPTRSSDARLAGLDGAFRTVVSGPASVAFLPDGRHALLVNRNSENVLVLDAATGAERAMLEDLPGALPDGVVVAPDGARAYVHERNTGDVVALAVGPGATLRVDGPPIPCRARDPMPPAYRAGQRVFYTANDRYGEFPITTNHWLACESCHPEGGTAAVTFRFAVGPRDTPSLQGGVDGFLQRTATRASLGELWRTINTEQGGHFRPDDEILGPYLDALVAYTARAIPAAPRPPSDLALVARGRGVFFRPDVGCAGCHAGPRYTDSGADNPALDLAGPVRLHDVGTCATDGPHPDRPHAATDGAARDACRFDTPSLVGAHATAPYLHDGRAATLRDVVTTHNAGDRHGATSRLTAPEVGALVAFLRAL